MLAPDELANDLDYSLYRGLLAKGECEWYDGAVEVTYMKTRMLAENRIRVEHYTDICECVIEHPKEYVPVCFIEAWEDRQYEKNFPIKPDGTTPDGFPLFHFGRVQSMDVVRTTNVEDAYGSLIAELRQNYLAFEPMTRVTISSERESDTVYRHRVHLESTGDGLSVARAFKLWFWIGKMWMEAKYLRDGIAIENAYMHGTVSYCRFREQEGRWCRLFTDDAT
jgi:hypothetical protein